MSNGINNIRSNSYDPTAPLDDSFKRTVTIYGREYQQYSIENDVYFSPIDEVLPTTLDPALSTRDVLLVPKRTQLDMSAC